MKRAFFVRSFLVAVAVLILSAIVSALVMERRFLEGRKTEARELLGAMSVSGEAGESVPDYGGLAKKFASSSPEPLRVAYLAPDGTVLGDSGAPAGAAENRKDRPEVAAAMKNGYGEDVRLSDTAGADALYAAKKLSGGVVLCLSVPVASFSDCARSLLPALLLGVLVALIVLPLSAWKLAENVVKPFHEVIGLLRDVGGGDGGTKLSEPEYREFAPFTRQINDLSHQIVEAHVQLTAERERITYLLDNMSEGLVVLDRSQRILLINRSAYAFFGSSVKLNGKNLLCLTHIPRVVAAARRASEKGQRSTFDFEPRNGEKTLQLFVSPVTGAEDRASDGVVLLMTDVTAVRRTEQIRSEFVANASHELKTPLTAIKGFAELIRSGIIKNPQKESEYLSLICSETERMIDLINDILHLSELESISEDTGESNVSLLAIAEKVRESLSIQAEGKDVTVTVSGDAGILNANPDRLTQLVLNLLDNAIKYNRSGGSVSVIVRQLRNAVTLTVSDTGIGIPPEAKDRVFERFYRVDKSRSRKIGGTGLGLSIVKHIVSLYHGRIDLKSEVGKGTVIEVTIPSGMHPAPPGGD